jgi:kynurenine formamidase
MLLCLEMLQTAKDFGSLDQIRATLNFTAYVAACKLLRLLECVARGRSPRRRAGKLGDVVSDLLGDLAIYVAMCPRRLGNLRSSAVKLIRTRTVPAPARREKNANQFRKNWPTRFPTVKLNYILARTKESDVFGNVRLIDLSVPLEDNAVSEPMPGRIHYIRHDGEGLEQMQKFFGIKPSDLVYSDGLGWAVEEIQAITHTGTHVDAPYHYAPKSEGKAARRIDQVPLEWCFAPGVVLDMRHKAAGDFITPEDLKKSLEAISYELRPLDIVLLQTGADKRINSPAYFAQPGLGREGVLWLVERGVRVIGIDAYTLDRPFANMVADYKRTGDGRFIWPAHFAGITREYCQIEKLANLDMIPHPYGFYVSCLPVKIRDASAGWCRAVAMVPGETT